MSGNDIESGVNSNTEAHNAEAGKVQVKTEEAKKDINSKTNPNTDTNKNVGYSLSRGIEVQKKGVNLMKEETPVLFVGSVARSLYPTLSA